ncbi:MAG: alpha/beta fold hydrolase [Armatimonadota bacterium]|nr:alpha/beta fold hydrolase [Armatimonadota bacterium]MDR7447744.1 alpha/beta fold hydrolase [Armatimonadota bacterium]MDR7458521.1 alpha/beta fold hydrolase [Armatimonadota bacterium]MDR7479922.1 alpha/beta fold hydrolase [Armatimonadota bacterium]MDR7487730.1 alpha/beta fold hydrolase [Armatimonadota bacterium]
MRTGADQDRLAAVRCADALLNGWRWARAWYALRGAEVPLGSTPADVAFTQGPVRLLHYRPAAKRVSAVPLLLVPSLINRHYVLDLTPRRSLVRYLRDSGFDVWLVDWGTPGCVDRFVTLGDHIDGYLRRCVDEVRAATGAAGLSLLGYCIGGVLTAIFTARHPRRVRNLVTLAAPIDFRQAGLLGAWAAAPYFPVDQLVDTLGNLPGWLLQASFRALRPLTRLRNLVALWERADDPEQLLEFVALHRWVEDNVPVSGETYRQFVRDCYQRNLLAEGRLTVDGMRVDLRRIRCPLLNVVATQDHICPLPSAVALNRLVGSRDVTLLTLPGGHVGAVVGREATEVFWPRLRAWLRRRSGSRTRRVR